MVCAINDLYDVINMINLSISAMYTLIYTLIIPLYACYCLFLSTSTIQYKHIFSKECVCEMVFTCSQLFLIIYHVYLHNYACTLVHEEFCLLISRVSSSLCGIHQRNTIYTRILHCIHISHVLLLLSGQSTSHSIPPLWHGYIDVSIQLQG